MKTDAFATLLVLELMMAAGFLVVRVIRRSPELIERLPVELSLVAAALTVIATAAGHLLVR